MGFVRKGKVLMNVGRSAGRCTDGCLCLGEDKPSMLKDQPQEQGGKDWLLCGTFLGCTRWDAPGEAVGG